MSVHVNWRTFRGYSKKASRQYTQASRLNTSRQSTHGLTREHSLGNEDWNSYHAAVHLECTSSTDLKRIQTPHSFYCDFRGDKPVLVNYYWLVRQFAFESSSSPRESSGHRSKGCSGRQSKVLTAKSMVKLLGPRSGTVLADVTGKRKRSALGELVAVAAGSNLLALASSTLVRWGFTAL